MDQGHCWFSETSVSVVCRIIPQHTMCTVLVTQSCPTLYDPWTVAHQVRLSLGILQARTRLGCHALLQGIFPTQRLNPGLPHCRWILYHLIHKGSTRKLEWVAYPFSRGSSQSRNWARVSCMAGRFFTSWAIREVPVGLYLLSHLGNFQPLFLWVLFKPLFLVSF